jgi:hypothetical protein
LKIIEGSNHDDCEKWMETNSRRRRRRRRTGVCSSPYSRALSPFPIIFTTLGSSKSGMTLRTTNVFLAELAAEILQGNEE